MDASVYVLIRLIDYDPEKVSHNPRSAKVRAVKGDWVSVDLHSRQGFRISTGLRKDGQYQIISGLEELKDGYRDPSVGGRDDAFLLMLENSQNGLS